MQETWIWSLGGEDSPGGGNGNPIQYSYLGNPVNRGAWWATVYGVAKELDSDLRDSITTTFYVTILVYYFIAISGCLSPSQTAFPLSSIILGAQWTAQCLLTNEWVKNVDRGLNIQSSKSNSEGVFALGFKNESSRPVQSYTRATSYWYAASPDWDIFSVKHKLDFKDSTKKRMQNTSLLILTLIIFLFKTE